MAQAQPKIVALSRNELNRYLRELAKVMRGPRNQQEMESFLDDFLAPAEIVQLVERYRIGDRLLLGKPQRQVKADLGVSISKVSRVANMLKHGVGGFTRAWQNLQR